MHFLQLITILIISSTISALTESTETTLKSTEVPKVRASRQDILGALSEKSDYTSFPSKRDYKPGHDFGYDTLYKNGPHYGVGPLKKGHLLNGHGNYYHGKAYNYDYKPYGRHYVNSGYGKKYDKYLDHGKVDNDHGHYEKALVYKGHGKKHYEYDTLKDGHAYKSAGGHHSKQGSSLPYYKHQGSYDDHYSPHDYYKYSPGSSHFGKYVKGEEHSKDVGAKDYHREKIEDTLVENKYFSEKVSDSHLHDRHAHLEKDKKIHGTGAYHHKYPHGYGGYSKSSYPNKDWGYGYGHAKPYLEGDYGYDEYNNVYPQKVKTLTKAVTIISKPK